MERTELDQALRDLEVAGKLPSKPDSSSSPRLSEGAAREAAERVRMFTKLATLYPVSGTQDAAMLIAALVDETQDIPSYWISCGLAALTRDGARTFCPTVSDIRLAAVKAIRAARLATERANLGKYAHADGYTGHAELQLNATREIAWAWVRGLTRQAQLAGLPVELKRIRYPEEPSTPRLAAGNGPTFHAERVTHSGVKGTQEIAAPRADVTEYGDPEMP